MRVVLLIIIGILLTLLTNLFFWRVYFRTRLRGFFIIAVGTGIITIGIVGYIIGKEDISEHIVLAGRILIYIGIVVYCFLDGIEQEMKGYSMAEIVIDGVYSTPFIPYKMIPAMTKRNGAILGILTIIAGVIASFQYPISELFPVGTFFILGLVVLVISIIFLPGSKEKDSGSAPQF
ncbi:MAG: hypothetical protein JSU92_14785 [Deltaproteobacteria bacterium]|nr:MAG: hypothetical protein JSU92_14785 [Deltaproteobacteria bacterium]